MKLRTTLIVVLSLTAILFASPLGYSYTYTVAQKTTGHNIKSRRSGVVWMTPGVIIYPFFVT
jgi:hypothetical protein